MVKKSMFKNSKPKKAVDVTTSEDTVVLGDLEIPVVKETINLKEESISNLKAASRRGRERSDPRFIEEAKRDPGTLDMGQNFDLKMTINDRSGQTVGYHCHWIIDKPGRIERLLGIGYEPIYKDGVKIGDGPDDFNENMDTWISMISGTLEGGAPQRSYALKIRQELYDLYKDKQRQENVIDVMNQIKSGKFEEKEGDGRYVKTIKIDN